MLRPNLFVRWTTITLFASLVGCATYHHGSSGRKIPGGYDRISVPTFKNSSFEVGVESYFTNALVEEIERGHLARISSKEEAQVLMEGEVTEVKYGRGADLVGGKFEQLPQSAVLTKEYRIFVGVKLQLVRRSDGRVLWSGAFNGERLYPAPQITIPKLNAANALYNQSARMQNMQLLAKDMMTKAHSSMTENF